MNFDDDEAISLLDIADFVVRWWRVYAIVAFSFAGLAALAHLALPHRYKVGLEVSAYPSIPGTDEKSVEYEIARKLQGTLPQLKAGRSGYHASAGDGAEAEKFAAIIRNAMSDYRQVLRDRIATAERRLESEMAAHPSNANIYERLGDYRLYKDKEKSINLFDYTVKVSPAYLPPVFLAILGAFSGIIVTTVLIFLSDVARQWRQRRADRAKMRTIPVSIDQSMVRN